MKFLCPVRRAGYTRRPPNVGLAVLGRLPVPRVGPEGFRAKRSLVVLYDPRWPRTNRYIHCSSVSTPTRDICRAHHVHSQRDANMASFKFQSVSKQPKQEPLCCGYTHAQTLAWPSSLSWCLTASLCAARSALLTSASAVSMAWLVRSRCECGDRCSANSSISGGCV